jgi:ABC-type antimicrobial peptide transport system permease subunit
MSRRFWGNPDTAVGKIVQVEGANSRVVGVAEDGKYGSLQEESQPFLFVATPFGKRGEGMLLIETAPEPSAMAGAVRKAIHDTDPDAWILNLISLRQNMRLPLLPYRIASGLVGTIGALAIFLAAVGLYGLVSYSVSRRTHEIGVRVVMGARPSDVLALVFREAMSRLAIGSAIGMTLALAVAQVVRSALYGVRPTDPLGIAAAVAVVAAVGSLAAYAPARRALRVDPATALRQE